ncbi:hypothetical protein IMX07_16405 [bacterium]|nr:hypothetical protein [bacterium]
MARWLNSDRGWALALMLIVALLLAGIPVVADAPLSGGPPALMVDICHPQPGINVSTAPCEAARTRVVQFPELFKCDFGAVALVVAPQFDRPSDTPDPPPPRVLI